MDSDCWKLVLSAVLLSYGVCQQSCPEDVFKTGASTQLTCTKQGAIEVEYLTPNGSLVAGCALDTECSASSVTNQNKTYNCVELEKLKLWICEDVLSNVTGDCSSPSTESLTTATVAVPQCKAEQLYIHLFSLGVGVAIGATVAILLVGICLAAWLPRRKTSCCNGGKERGKSESKRADHIRKPRTNVSGSSTEGNEIEMQRNHYDELQRRSCDVPPPYEQLSQYQTL